MERLQLALLGLVIGAAAIWAVRNERLRRASLAAYWQRGCAGRAWRDAFPDASKEDIRQFLYLVVDAFGFGRERALQLAPTDSPLSLYHAAYPDPSAPDALEIETLCRSISMTYGAATLEAVAPGISFGELFARTVVLRSNISLQADRER
jgi:hypothetical protein